MENQALHLALAKDLLTEAIRREDADEGSNDLQRSHNKGIAQGFKNAAVLIAAKVGFIIDADFVTSVRRELDAGSEP